MLRLRKYITGFSGICGGPFYRIVCHVKVSLTGLQPTVAVSSLCCPTSVFVLHIVSVCVCVCVCMLSLVQLFVTPWTVAFQAPLSMGFPGKNIGVGCHFLLQGIFLTQG